MKDKPAKGTPTLPATRMNVQNAILGLRGRDLLSTLRNVSRHGLRHPLHTAHHLLALGGQLGRVLLGDTPHQPNPRDPRFNDPTWSQNPFYRRGLQAYLAWQKQTRLWIEESHLDDDDRARAHFLFNLINDALAPSNSLLTHWRSRSCSTPAGRACCAVWLTCSTTCPHDGLPRQVDERAFEVGGMAATPGAVVFRNELLELIQYKPMSEKQHARPLLVVPPQINKFYIFDLSPTNSFVQYMLKSGLQVFMISWRNPDPRHREWGLSSYVQALEEALNACRSISGNRDPNLMGACAGGLTMAALQGHLQARQQLPRVRSATYLVSLLDSKFESPASLFADEQTIEAAKRRSYQRGVLDGAEVARIFAWMRPNDLIWKYGSTTICR
uniref:Truncated PHA polymerase 2 n=1 Tax=Pseudomonas sp. LDC-25 TaxID=281994 RepID=A3E7L7_9PSED|nr:truncated PHA polymerase 2 [Pseudomonas sp. LDC-25]